MGSLRRQLILVWCCGVVAGGLVPAVAADLDDIRLYPAVEYTRLVVEAAELPGYRLSVLSDPARLVFDVTTDDSDELLDAVRNRDLSSSPYLKSIRAARFSEDKVRIVFDLQMEVKYSLFTLKAVSRYGDRVVLDISPKATGEANYGLLQDLGFKAVPSAPVKPKPPPRVKFHVMIDPGHGGEDPGAVNQAGLKEKHIVLDIAKKLQQRLEQIPTINAQLTRSSDIFLPLATRVRLAQDANADLFVSIHADSFTSARPRGASVFVLSRKGASSRFAQRLAEHANLSDIIGGINTGAGSNKTEQALTGIFKDGTERASRGYAELALKHMGTISEIHGAQVHAAGFAVLKSPSIPSALVEVGFISNPQDAQLLTDNSYRSRVAEQIAAAIVEYQERQQNSHDTI